MKNLLVCFWVDVFYIDQCILSCCLTSLMITFGMMVGGLIPPSPPSHLARNTTLPPHLWTMHMPSSHCWTTKYGMVSTNSKHKSSACIFSGQSSRKFYTNRSWFTNLETKLYQNSLIETKTFVCLDTVYFSRENSSILVFTTCSKVTKNLVFHGFWCEKR